MVAGVRSTQTKSCALQHDGESVTSQVEGAGWLPNFHQHGIDVMLVINQNQLKACMQLQQGRQLSPLPLLSFGIFKASLQNV